MRRHKLMAVMLSLALVGAVACGDDDDDTQASTSDEGGSEGGGAAGEAVTIEGGDDMNAILLPKCTGIAVSILEKQVGELRRRLNATGDVSRPAIRPRWANRLRIDVNGTPERNEANVITALSCDEAFAGTLVFDEFRQEIVVNRPLPWDEGDADTPRPWTDSTYAALSGCSGARSTSHRWW